MEKGEVECPECGGLGLEILSGLSEGELLVTAGVRRLTDGEAVKMQESAS